MPERIAGNFPPIQCGPPWFDSRDRNPTARVILFCLPFSGGGARVFGKWRQLFPDDIEVTPVHLPGREERAGQPADLSPGSVAVALAERIDRPFALYGHSMGARLGFEVLRSLRDLGVRPPIRFYPAASLPPDVPDPYPEFADLPDGLLVDSLIDRFGAPEELRESPGLRSEFLPVLREDLRWCRRHRYLAGPPLDTTIVALAGRSDAEATPAAMRGWCMQGTSGEVLTLPGGHFFLLSATRQLAALLAHDLVGANRPAGGQPVPVHEPS